MPEKRDCNSVLIGPERSHSLNNFPLLNGGGISDIFYYMRQTTTSTTTTTATKLAGRSFAN